MALSIVEASQKLARHLTLASSIPKHATSNWFLDSEPPQPPTIISKDIGMSEIGGYLQNSNCSPFSTSLQGVVTDISILSHIIHVTYSPFFCYPTITTSVLQQHLCPLPSSPHSQCPQGRTVDAVDGPMAS